MWQLFPTAGKKKALAKVQEQMNLPQHALITECPTRWGSRQRRVERILEQHKAIQQVLSEDKKHRHLIPTWQDVEVLESINKALGPLLEFTDALSGEQQVTVSYVTPVLSLFNNDVLAVQSDDTDLTKDIKRSILTYLNSKFAGDNVVELLGMASTLDPRFKHHYNKDEQILAIESALKAELMALENEEDKPAATEAAASHSTTAVPEEEGTSDSETLPAKKTKKSFGSYLKKHSKPTG